MLLLDRNWNCENYNIFIFLQLLWLHLLLSTCRDNQKSKTGKRSEVLNNPFTMPFPKRGDWFTPRFLLATPTINTVQSFHFIVSDGVISGIRTHNTLQVRLKLFSHYTGPICSKLGKDNPGWLSALTSNEWIIDCITTQKYSGSPFLPLQLLSSV